MSDDISNRDLLARIEQLLAVSQQERLIRLPEVMHLTGMGKSNIYNKIKDGSFPPGRNLSGDGRIRVWTLSEVNAWIQNVINPA